MRPLMIAIMTLGWMVAAGRGATAAPAFGQSLLQPAEPAGHDEEHAGVDYVVVPPDRGASRRSAGLARVIYLNRCVGGCAVGNERNDATANQSTIAKRPGTVAEFPFNDAAWTSLMQCVHRAYEMYDVTVTDTEPVAGVDHVEVLVAGEPTNIGFPVGTLGIAPLATDCSPLRNVLAFAFAESHRSSGIIELCATVVHEAGHAFGLDHAMQCRDPMTYLTSCGDRLFLNIESKCGEFRTTRNCRCGDTQNSHVKLLNELGPSGHLPSAGSVQLEALPAWDGSQLVGFVVESRWIRSIELWINGFRWKQIPHMVVSDFRFVAPPVSDGILDIEVRSVNDLGGVAVNKLTLTKGAPCQSSASCAAPEVCQEGRCMYPPPTGELGSTCTAPQDCASWECLQFAGQQRCALPCSVGLKRSECPANYTCVKTAEPAPGMCWPTEELPESGGCATSGRAPGLILLLALLGLRRRRSLSA